MAGMFLFFIPLVLLELGLFIWALVDLVNRKRMRGETKILWALIIILVGVIGPILYLLLGRKEDNTAGGPK
jgi:hypothetical protein